MERTCTYISQNSVIQRNRFRRLAPLSLNSPPRLARDICVKARVPALPYEVEYERRGRIFYFNTRGWRPLMLSFLPYMWIIHLRHFATSFGYQAETWNGMEWTISCHHVHLTPPPLLPNRRPLATSSRSDGDARRDKDASAHSAKRANDSRPGKLNRVCTCVIASWLHSPLCLRTARLWKTRRRL